MKAQIYLTENKELIYDGEMLDEFNALVDELGLKCNNVKDGEKSPIPYMWLDEATIRAFKLLCPRVDKVGNYPMEIPLEVLRHLKLSKNEKYFDEVEVWSNTKDPDPFMIGKVYKTNGDREKKYTWNMQNYLIGRWGAEKKSIDELINLARKIAEIRIKTYAAAGIAKLKSWIECPDVWADNYIFRNNDEAQKAFGSDSGNLPF